MEGPTKGRGLRVVIAAAVVAAILAIYRDTAGSIVAIWARSDTFKHGFFIPAASLYLIYRQRDALRSAPWRPSIGALGAVGLFTAAWLLARASGILVLEQFAFTALIPSALLATLGWETVRRIAFPLAFLFLAVPAGDFLIPPLMDFTASFTVKALQVSGVPVARAAQYLVIPNGEWLIAEACSGFRYLMATLTVVLLYAYLQFRSLRLRLIFVLLGVLVPVLANGLRAYGVVILGYLSDMRIAVGVDHVIYGWLFFVVTTVGLLLLGSHLGRFDAPAPPRAGEPASGIRGDAPALRAALAGGIAVALAWSGPAYASVLDAAPARDEPVRIAVPDSIGGWQAQGYALTAWRPTFVGSRASASETYQKGDRTVGIFVAYYRDQRQGTELINSENVIVARDDADWRNLGTSVEVLETRGGRVEVVQTQVASRRTRLLVWHRYWVAGRYTRSPAWAKALQVSSRLLARKDDAAIIAVYAPYSGGREPAARALKEFLDAVTPDLEARLRSACARPGRSG